MRRVLILDPLVKPEDDEDGVRDDEEGVRDDEEEGRDDEAGGREDEAGSLTNRQFSILILMDS